jgi:hypothetical protein
MVKNEKWYKYFRSASIHKLELVHRAALLGGWCVAKNQGWLVQPKKQCRHVEVNSRGGHHLSRPLRETQVFTVGWWKTTRTTVVAVVDLSTSCVVFYKNTRLMNENNEEFVL